MDRPLVRPLSLALHRLALLALAGALLLTAFTGQAGVQILDQVTAGRIFALHLHGAPGEAAYVHTHNAAAPFVAAHCHNALPDAGAQPSADEVQASSLAGATLCADAAAAPALPAVWLTAPAAVAAPPEDLSAPPASPPPRD